MKDVELLERLLATYEWNVQFPDAHGFEHLYTLTVRSDLAEGHDALTVEQHLRLQRADRELLKGATRFVAAIEEFGPGGLAVYREEHPKPPEHWWWYLDIIARVAPYATWHVPESEYAA
ncbi:MAG: hypothetical protein JXB47_02010 [Anaerolineae bacterium]|nr:hypothetical protein [Anaerolineae bacterium]